jgi:hypothetical protein
MRQSGAPNIFLLTCRQQYDIGFRHAFVTRRMFECCLVSAKSREKTSGFPLFVLARRDEAKDFLLDPERKLNFSASFQKRLHGLLGVQVVDCDHPSPTQVSGYEVFNYIYAILHSPEYRERYGEQLKIDFPRIPLTSNLVLFRALAHLGGELVSLHLLESPKLNRPVTAYTGPTNPDVEKVSYLKGTICLNKAQTCNFRGVTETVWNFQIGGYQVCEKWLKDRRGRKLSQQDITHYQRVVVALHETIRLMGEIDAVIGEHGGWPLPGSQDAPEPLEPDQLPFA